VAKVSEQKFKVNLLDLRLLGRLFSYAKPYRPTVILSIVLSVVLSGLAVLRPQLIQLSVDNYIKNRLLQSLITISAIQLGLLICETFLRFWFMYRINWLGQTVVNDLRQSVFKKIIYQDVAFFDNTAIGTLTTRTINDLESVNDVFSEGFIPIVADLLTIVSIIVVMFVNDWRLTLVCLSVFPLLILATWLFKESVNKSFQRVRNAVSALNAFVQERITGMYIVQAFAAEARELGYFTAINKEHRNAHIKGIMAYSLFFPAVEIILAISLGLLVWYGAVRLLHYGVSVGTIIAFIVYLNLLFRPLRMLAEKFNVLQMGMVAGERVFAVLDNRQFLSNNGSKQADSITGAISFSDVHFSYKAGVPVLKGISFTVPAGKTMAVVGHTGAGKSSIINILNRQYEISSGAVTIDGLPLTDYDVYSLRKHIGIVLQDVFLFSGTVYDNITLRDTTIPRERVMEVCEILGIHSFIAQLPGGYEFNIMERGNALSQGQRQLLSFARALLYNPAILVLDEATSSVDSESEQLIQHAIETLIQNRTSIIIAHRLSTIRKADEILVLDHGEIIERGNHSTLMQQQGAYHELYTAVERQVGLKAV
jgi:ATP-binding cassette, subfamily B, multidrug efflux pump